MKKTVKILSVTAVIAVLFGATAGRVEAGSSWSIGVGYRSGGCAPRHGYGWGVSYGYRYVAPRVYYAPAPVVYYTPPPPPVQTVVYTAPPAPAPAPVVQQPVAQAMSVADVKTLTQAGVADEVIISQIRSSQTVFRLSTAAIIELKDSGVSQRVIDFMINTANQK